MSARDLYGEKGFIPFSRIQNPTMRPRAKICRWRAGPCFVMIATAFIIATFFLDTFGVKVAHAPDYRQRMNELKDSKGRPRVFEGWEKLDRFFVFGESYSDIGFDPEGTAPALGNPFGNPEFTAGSGIPRFGPMGPLWVHYATTVYNRSAVKTYDLARGGSTIDRELVNPIFPKAGTFGDQVAKRFAPQYGLNGPDGGWAGSRTLFGVFFGVMDVIISFHHEKRAPVAELVAAYFDNVERLFESGARNFVLFSLPPMDRSYQPSKKGVKDLRKDIADFNARLKKTKWDFEHRHRNTNIWLFDTAAFFEDVITNPKRFPQTKKISYTKGPCPLYDLGIGADGEVNIDRLHHKCGVPVSQYLWHDFIHMTYPTHDALAATMVEDCMGERRKRYCS